MDGMTTAWLYRSHRLYDHPCHAREPVCYHRALHPTRPSTQSQPCQPLRLSYSHASTHPHHTEEAHPTANSRRRPENRSHRRDVPWPSRVQGCCMREGRGTSRRSRRSFELSPGLLACNTLACEKARGRLDDASGFRVFGDYSRWGGPTRVRPRRWCLCHVNICSRVVCLQPG